MENIDNKDYSLEEELEKELYGQKSSERKGKVKKIWGVKIKQPLSSSEEWRENIISSNLFDFFNFNLKKLFFIFFFIFLVSGTIFAFVFYYRSIYIGGISLEINGPLEVNSLQPYEYLFKVNNNSNVDISDVILNIKLEESVYFLDNLNQNEIKYSLDNIQAKNSKEVKIKLIFLSSLGKNINLTGELIYASPKKNQKFSLSKNLIVTIKKEPFNIQVFAPNKVFINEPFLISMKIINTSEDFYDFYLNLDNINGLEILSIDPAPYSNDLRNLEWSFSDLQPNKTEEINITAKFVQYLEKPVINFYPKVIFKNKEFVLKNSILTLNVIDSPVTLIISSNPDDYLVDVNREINYEVRWENKSKVNIENVQIKVYLEGNFDFESIKTDGYFSPVENSIIWNSRNKPELINIKPKDSGSVRFTIKTLKNYPVGEKNLTLLVKALLETETIPPEIQILSKKLSIETQQTKIIPGKIEVNANVAYDNQFNNSGPFPLVKGEKTTLTTYLDFCTFGEDFENIIIKNKIPLGVNLTGSFDLNFDVNNFQFDANTGEFNYRLDELSAGYCDIYSPYKIIFQIAVIPPLYGNINDFVVLPPFQISAKGKFSQKAFDLKTREIKIFNIKK
jgi:hypothetical protein